MNGKLLYETKGTKHIHYVYDSNGNVISAIYNPTSSGTEQIYYYAHNWRGDVIALYNSAGTLFARYEYDAWGKLLSVKDSSGNAITDSSNFAIINSIRYRDIITITKAVCIISKAVIYNLIEYCNNNPVSYIDPNGHLGYYGQSLWNYFYNREINERCAK